MTELTDKLAECLRNIVGQRNSDPRGSIVTPLMLESAWETLALFDAAKTQRLAATPAPAPQWQPIETAPEGTMILCANMNAAFARDWCYVAWMAGGKVCGCRMDKPTHWMPLPAAPDQGKEASK